MYPCNDITVFISRAGGRGDQSEARRFGAQKPGTAAWGLANIHKLTSSYSDLWQDPHLYCSLRSSRTLYNRRRRNRQSCLFPGKLSFRLVSWDGLGVPDWCV